jgi:hypothetical protein
MYNKHRLNYNIKILKNFLFIVIPTRFVPLSLHHQAYIATVLAQRPRLVLTNVKMCFCCTLSQKILLLSQRDQRHRRCVTSVRFQVLKAASMKMAVFWVVSPCSLVEVYRSPL